MGFFDNIFGGGAAEDAARENQARLTALKGEGLGYLDAGKTGALGALDATKGIYSPLASKYGAGTDLYLSSLGVNGAAGNDAARNAFQAGPGYEFGVNQSLDALDRRAASRGMLASGNNTIDTLGTVTGLANQEYGNWQNRLAGLVSPELAATGGMAGAEMAKAPVYTNDANSRVNLASGVTNGLNSQTTQAANAEMQGSNNLLNFGMNLAKMGIGAAAGGFGGLGGAAGGTGMLGAAQSYGSGFGQFQPGYNMAY